MVVSAQSSNGAATVDPTLVPSPEVIGEAFAEQAATLKAAGADLILLELMYEPGHAALAVEAALNILA